jgi:proteasome lid subunit RPN8/RPN11
MKTRPLLPPARHPPPLRFTPYAWAKWEFLRDRGPTEIAGFGISALEDSLLVEDLVLIPQQATVTTVAFDDLAVAEFFDEQVDRGLRPEQFARIWLHTHPGHSPQPSGTDEETFAQVFGNCSWAVMAILAQGGDAYARLRCQTGFAVEVETQVAIDFRASFPGSDVETWATEYDACVLALEGRVSRQQELHPASLRHLAAAVEAWPPETLFEDLWWERSADGVGAV